MFHTSLRYKKLEQLQFDQMLFTNAYIDII